MASRHPLLFTLRSPLLVLVSLTWIACFPKRNLDLDGDGVLDAEDVCMADPGPASNNGCPGEARVRDLGSNVNEAGEPVTESGTAIEPDPETTTRGLARSKDKPFKTIDAVATIVPFHKKASTVEVDVQERSAVIFGISRGSITSGGREKSLGQLVSKAFYSPDGKYVGLVGSSGFSVVEVKHARTVHRFKYAKGTAGSPETKHMHLSASEVLYYDGCQIFRAPMTGRAAPKALSARLCGEPQSSDDGKRWLVWQRDTDDDAVRVYRLGLEGEEPKLVIGGVGDAPGLSLLRLSPDGRYLCYSKHKDGSELRCRDSADNSDTLVWEGATSRHAIFHNKSQLVFGAGERRTPRDFLQADLSTGTLRRIGTVGPKEGRLFAVNDTLVAATGGKRLVLFDLKRSVQVSIPLGAGEWQGFARIPGKDREFIVGKERGATRDLYRATVK